MDKYETLFQNARDGIILVDKNCKIIDLNKAILKIFEYGSFSHLIGKSIDVLIPRKYKESKNNILKKAEHITFEQFKEIHPTDPVEYFAKKSNGDFFSLEVTIGSFDFDGEKVYVCIVRDITKRKIMEERSKYWAQYDPLTKFLNRQSFFVYLKKSMESAKRYKKQIALFYIDLDDFKTIDNKYGHILADIMLMKVGRRLQNNLRKSDIIGRLTLDKFVVLIDNVENIESVSNIAKKLLFEFSKEFLIGDGNKCKIGLSIGICVYPCESIQTSEELFWSAVNAMNKVKNSGKNNFRFSELNKNLFRDIS